MDQDPDAPPIDFNALVSLPEDVDCCLECGYSLRSLDSWRCPECNHYNSERDLIENRSYVSGARKFALRCVVIPLGIYLGLVPIMVVVGLLSKGTPFEMASLILFTFIMTFPYIFLQLWMIVHAAARLTQVRLIQRPKPAALAERPFKALPIFVAYLTAFSALPILTVIAATSALAAVVD